MFSFVDGLLTYDPATPGTLLLHIFPIYVYWLRSQKPQGTSAPQVIRYENVRVATIGPYLLPWVKTFYLKALQEGAGQPDETDVDVLAAKYLEQFFLGKVAVLVEGGMKIGEADDLDATHRADVPIPRHLQWPLRLDDRIAARAAVVRRSDLDGSSTGAGGAPRSDPGFDLRAIRSCNDIQQKQFIALPAGVSVDLRDADFLTSDKKATAMTDAFGQVEFVFQDAAAIEDIHGTDLFLLVHTNGMAHAGHAALPQEWSTKGWHAVDGTPGYQTDFGGTSWGTADAPLLFRIGVDFHLSIQYTVGTQAFGAPPDLPIRFVNASQDFTTDAKGYGIQGFWLDADAGDDLLFQITGRIGPEADPDRYCFVGKWPGVGLAALVRGVA